MASANLHPRLVDRERGIHHLSGEGSPITLGLIAPDGTKYDDVTKGSGSAWQMVNGTWVQFGASGVAAWSTVTGKPAPFSAVALPANGRTTADYQTYLSNNAVVNVLDFMTSAQVSDVISNTGSVDITAAFNTATAISGARVRLPAGTYLFASNPATPACSTIEGDGEMVTILKVGSAVTTTLPLDSACTRLSGFQVLGNTTANARGIVFGNAAAGAYRVDHVRVKLFTGAGAVGVLCQNALKSQFDKLTVERNSLNLLIDGTGGLGGGYPTTLQFNSLVCIDAGLGGGGGIGQGVKIVTADGVVFNEPAFDSCVAEAVMIQPAASGTVVGVVFKNPRFEANNNGGSSTYQMVVDGTAAGCTARVAIRGGAWSAGASTAKSLHLTGAGVAGYVLDNTQVLNATGTVVIDTGAYGQIVNWPSNLPANCVSDTTTYGANYGRGQLKFPSAQNASTDVNTLDDYVESTFTPTIVLGAGSVTYTTQTGSATKIGRLVTVQVRIVVNTATTPSSSLQIGGIPYTASAGSKGSVSVFGAVLAASATQSMIGQVDAGAATIRLYRPSGAGSLVDPGADLQAGSVINLTASFEV